MNKLLLVLMGSSLLWISSNFPDENEGRIDKSFNWNSLDLNDSLSLKTYPGVFVKEKDKSVPLSVQELKVDIQVLDNFAITTMEMTFSNELDRILEGQLYFPLSQGQTVSRFAMEVNGKLREGVVVEKQKGRQAFESTTRQQIDPGLIEWTKGNNFKARVYPIPAKGTKKILVAYSQELKSSQGYMIYTLPMNFEGKLKQLDFNVQLDGTNKDPIIRSNEYQFNFQKTNQGYNASSKQQDVRADKSVQLAIPENEKLDLITYSDGGKDYFYYRVKTKPHSFQSLKTSMDLNLILESLLHDLKSTN